MKPIESETSYRIKWPATAAVRVAMSTDPSSLSGDLMWLIFFQKYLNYRQHWGGTWNRDAAEHGRDTTSQKYSRLVRIVLCVDEERFLDQDTRSSQTPTSLMKIQSQLC